ncbi:MAG: M23 family peptidase, partial [Fulvivirga sp.]|nr:M23 family peptidase [Fulvivirga sp.]
AGTVQLVDNTLVITTSIHEEANTLSLHLPEEKSLPASYLVNGKSAVYLWDMKQGLPKKITASNGLHLPLNYKNAVPPASVYNFYDEKMDIRFPKYALFDTLFLQSDYQYDSLSQSEYFLFGDENVPLRKNINVTLKPIHDYDVSQYDVYKVDNAGGLHYEGGSWKDNKISFRTRSFGKYTIATDTVPPKILPLKINAQDLKFKIWDDLSGIEEFVCTVNGQWVLMHYDYKQRLIWSEKLKDEKFSGEVKLILTDRTGNQTEYIANL